jgi:hypothetical protein
VDVFGEQVRGYYLAMDGIMQKNVWRPAGRLLSLCAGLSLGLLAGCDRSEDVRSYTIEKTDDHHVSRLLTGPENPPAQNQSDAAELSNAELLQSVQWTIPAQWHQESNPRRMILAVFHPNNREHKPDIEVSSFSGDVGGVLANVNRWRQQIGLPPVSDETLHEHIEFINTQGSFGGMIDAHNPQTGRRTVAVIIQVGTERSWFIKATGDDALVTDQKQLIRQFAESFRFVRPGAVEAQAPVAASTETAPAAVVRPALPGDIAYSIPSNWQAQPVASAMLHAMFESTSDKGKAVVTVSRLNGDGGGLLPNINRWRGQVGLQPVASLAMQPVSILEVQGSQATLVDLTGAEGSFAGQRMLMGVVTRPQETWYFKLTGSNDVAEEQKAQFISVIESARFQEGR